MVVGSSGDDRDGTVRVSARAREQAKERVQEVIGSDPTVMDPVSGAGAALASNEFSDPRPSEPDLARGAQVGEYVIEEVIGRGGFGTVYRANHPLIGKQVAIKLLSRKCSADSDTVSRFIAEARAVNQIRHRHIIDIFSFGQLDDGRHFYVMEYLDGEPLDRYLAMYGPIPLDKALPILRAVARALDAAHAKGIAHRDLKPENILLARDDDGTLFPKLLDFGIAKLMGPEDARTHKTGTGVPLGTPYYMSPEQCRGRDVDHRTDIYSFGVMTFRLLTGEYPFNGELIDILHKQIYEDPPRASRVNAALAPEIDAALAWMMRKDVAQRPRSLIEAVVALGGEAVVSGSGVTTPMTASGKGAAAALHVPAFPEAPRKRRWVIPVLVVAVAAAAAAIAIVTWQGRSGEPAAKVTPAPAPAPAPAPVTPQPVKPAAQPAPAPATATATPYVTLTLAGVPDGTEVVVGGHVIGVAPLIQLQRGDTQVLMTLKAEGYLPASKQVVPDHDQKVDVQLKKKRVARPNTPAPAGEDKEDVIHVFGKDKKE